MAGGGKKSKRKRKAKGRQDHTAHFPGEDAAALLAEELTALSAIFQEDFELITEYPVAEFSISIRPHDQGRNEGSTSAELLVRCLPGYPCKPPKVQVIADGLSSEDLQILQSLLLEQAASIAREGRVMVFNLAEAAREFLSEHSVNACSYDKQPTPSQHFADEPGNETRKESPILMGIAESFLGCSTFCDLWDDAEANWGGGADAPGTITVHSSKHTSSVPEPDKNLRRLAALKISNPSIPTPKNAPVLGTWLEDEIRHDDAIIHQSSNESAEDANANDSGYDLDDSGHHETQCPRNDVDLASVSEFLQTLQFGTIQQTIKQASKFCVAVGPELKGAREALAGDVADDQDFPIAIQRVLLLGQLLRLVCGQRGPLANALPILTSQLQKLGVLPSWIKDLLLRQPHFFEAAFKRAFADDALGIREPKMSREVHMFWDLNPQLIGEGDNSAALSSRYLSDFEEISLLGKGGFGHVVLCKHKLDGRRYAMKKIRLRNSDPLVDHKILREVATLSRLQHQHVVRYYQAWFETATGGGSIELLNSSSELESYSDWIVHDGRTYQSTSMLDSNRSGAAGLPVTFLYIQMEYCPRTLRQVFETYAPPVDKDITWRMFRQIVEGLAHIHAQRIIHRDLTPNNIFFDIYNDIKIGDFGLAKFTSLEQGDVDTVAPVSKEVTMESLDGTGQVGTYFYTAPEIEQGWPHIDEKVDMYSLGVVLFELWHPFTTAMERHVVLTELKKGILPLEWGAGYPQQAALVRLLLSPNPADRPSALEVLHSELVPPRMEDEALTDILRTIQSADNSAVFDQIIAAIFNEQRVTMKAESADSESLRLKRRERDLRAVKEGGVRDHILDIAKEAFIRHGARSFESAGISIIDDPEMLHRSAVKVIGSSGSMLELRYDVRLTFARWVAAQQVVSRKGYAISQMYRKGVGHSAPKEYFQGDYDTIGGSVALVEAEIIKVAEEILFKVPSLEMLEIRLNDRKLLNAIWEWSGVLEEQRQNVAQVLATMTAACPQSTDRKSRWVFVRRQLIQGLGVPEVVVDKLQLAERRFTGNANDVLSRLRGALPSSSLTSLAIENLSSLLSCLRVWEMEKFAIIDVLMAPAEEYFDGMFFQIFLPKGSYPGQASQNTLVAVGGRYDQLLRHYWARYSVNASTAPGAVGISIALQKLIDIASLASKFEPVTDILVCCRGGGGLLKERMEVTAELWAANLKAEYVCSAAPSLTDQYEYATAQRIKYLVIITDIGLTQSGLVKVRNLEQKNEEEVPLGELVRYFTERLSAPNTMKKRAQQREDELVILNEKFRRPQQQGRK